MLEVDRGLLDKRFAFVDNHNCRLRPKLDYTTAAPRLLEKPG
jgi:hypothetical protein